MQTDFVKRMAVCIFFAFCHSIEYFVSWNGDNRTICHSLWPCKWEVAINLFKRDDIIQITDPILQTEEQLRIFQNMTKYVLETGGGIASSVQTKIDGTVFEQNETDFFLEISPFNDSFIFGFDFIKFHHPIISVRGNEFFLITNCSFYNSSVMYDYPLLSFCNVTGILSNTTIYNNYIEGSSVFGLSTSSLGFYNGSIQNNVQLSRGSIPLIEVSNAVIEFTNSTILNNSTPNSPLFGYWLYGIIYATNTTISNNFCGHSALIVGDSITNLTIYNSTISNNNAAFVHSMCKSMINITSSVIKENIIINHALIYSPQSTVYITNNSYLVENIAENIISSKGYNETYLYFDYAVLTNNTHNDIGFSLTESNSFLNNSYLSSNNGINNSTFLLNSSNLSLYQTSFFNNWVINNGNVVQTLNTNLDIRNSAFYQNVGNQSGVFVVLTQKPNKTIYYHFENSYFLYNIGNEVSSVFFDIEIPESVFEYCNFSSYRFQEVNGNLDLNQVFHRCRFNQGRKLNLSSIDDNVTVRKNDVRTKVLIAAIISYALLFTMVLIALFKYFLKKNDFVC